MTTRAVCLVIVKGDRYLLGKRSPQKQAAPLYWCPISGRIEPGESEEDAVVREALEEVGLTVRPLSKLFEVPTTDRTCMLNWWSVVVVHGEAHLANDEHTELKWVTLEEMKKLEPIFHEDIAFFRAASKGSTP